MSSSCIWPIDWTLSGTTSPSQSGPGSNDNKEVVHIPQSWSLTVRLFSVIYSGHSLGESYLSIEMKLAYSAAPADWANFALRFLISFVIYQWAFSFSNYPIQFTFGQVFRHSWARTIFVTLHCRLLSWMIFYDPFNCLNWQFFFVIF